MCLENKILQFEFEDEYSNFDLKEVPWLYSSLAYEKYYTGNSKIFSNHLFQNKNKYVIVIP